MKVVAALGTIGLALTSGGAGGVAKSVVDRMLSPRLGETDVQVCRYTFVISRPDGSSYNYTLESSDEALCSEYSAGVFEYMNRHSHGPPINPPEYEPEQANEPTRDTTSEGPGPERGDALLETLISAWDIKREHVLGKTDPQRAGESPWEPGIHVYLDSGEAYALDWDQDLIREVIEGPSLRESWEPLLRQVSQEYMALAEEGGRVEIVRSPVDDYLVSDPHGPPT